MTQTEEAIRFVDSHRRVRLLPVSSSLRHTLVRHYIFARRTGKSHAEAKKYATLGIDPITLMLIGWAIQIIFHLVKLWWERRDA